VAKKKQSLFALRIQALALFAVFFFNCLLECFRAAITAVVIATTVVVVVVTVSIAFEFCRTTFIFAFVTFVGGGINTLAFFAEFFDDSLKAAITAVVIATTVIVFVVTVAIAFVVCHTTFIFAFVTFGAVIRLILRVQAFALFAEFCPNFSIFGCCFTAIATVVIAAAVVVLIVAVAISFVSWSSALPGASTRSSPFGV